VEVRVRAVNPPGARNPVHDDDFARRLGFRGGLVPGVDVYAYMARVPESAWGAEWSRAGSMWARFAKPVYDGEEVVVRGSGADGELELELRSPEGELCAVGGAARRVEGPAPAASAYPAAPLPERPGPPAFVEGQVLGSLRVTLQLPDGAWPARLANDLLTANVELPPWMHVESRVRHLDGPVVGERAWVRGRVSGLWERRGHRFVALEVLVLGEEERSLAALTHVAIYELAQLR
jgi:hypothetical protein